jgi:hypothetical protein
MRFLMATTAFSMPRLPIPSCRLLALLLIGLTTRPTRGELGGAITRGSVQNLTRGQPAAGDEVLLIRLDQGLDRGTELGTEAQTQTDAQGGFVFQVRSPDKPYLVRVVHQGVAYDQKASGGDNLSISVFDAAPKVPAITGSVEILRVGTRIAANQEFLHISDMYEIQNESSPPMTQAGASTFDVYLAANARIDSVLAAGPSPNQNAAHEKMGLMISAVPVAGEPGHYTVNFPLRPGATKFAFNYDVPYQGRATLQTRREYGFQQFAVMMPSSMRFSSPSAVFQKLPTGDNEYQVHAVMRVRAGDGPPFEVSGTGPLPSLQAKNQAPAQAPLLPSSTTSNPTRAFPASRLRSESKSEETQPLWPWQVLTGGLTLACILLVALLLLRTHNQSLGLRLGNSAVLGDPAQPSSSVLESLKQKLFQLEADRARGSISAAEYSSARLVLEETVERAVGPNSGAAILAQYPETPSAADNRSGKRSGV